jgi:DNA (cytosine-5)-methyltransferase 1/tRNA (cytosine38-C5)-methyltransferase
MELLARIPDEKLPANLALENVAGFTQSAAREKLLRILAGRGYSVRERTLCPTELGVPSRRPRYYLAASLLPFTPENQSQPGQLRPLSGYLDKGDPLNLCPDLQLPSEIVSRFGKGLPILEPSDQSVCATCFTAGYGRSIANSGSYLVCDGVVRYFSPEEITRLLHFPHSFRFPEKMPLRKRWHLAGNSLSVVAVREILRSFPDLVGTPI